MRKLFIAMLLPIALLAQGGGQPINVPIQNPSFEQPPSRPFTQDPCGPWVDQVPGWTATPLQGGTGAGIMQPTEPSPVNNGNCLGGISPAPDGITVAYLSSYSISQNLGTAPGNNGIYTFTIYFADRFYWYSAHYSASIQLGTDTICSISGEARGDFTQVPIVCPVQKNPTPRDLTITITGYGQWIVLVDKVSLTFTPID